MRKATELIAICERDGEETIKKQLIEKTRFSHYERSVVEEWLQRKVEERTASSTALRDAREERTLSIAEEALSIAKEANRIASEDLKAALGSAASAREQARWAMWAAIIATVAAIITAITYIKAP